MNDKIVLGHFHLHDVNQPESNFFNQPDDMTYHSLASDI